MRRAALTWALAVAAAAQNPAAVREAEQLRGELAAAQRDLQRVRSDGERLLDLRIRHDLGLPCDQGEDLFRSEQPATTPATERARKEFADEEATTAGLLARHQKLEQLVGRLEQEAAARAQQQRKDEEWITVPAPGSRPAGVAPGAGPAPVPPAAPGPETGAPAAFPPASPLRVVPNLDPIRAQIDGSRDHSRVAQALFRAGQTLMDRAAALRRQGQDAAGLQCDDAARERLVRAIDELEPSTTASDPPYVDLFYLGKCRELLFRIAERRDGLSLHQDAREYQRREQEVRDPFLAITARDVVARGGNEQLGEWGRAAQVATEHFRWMNLHRGFAPRTPPESITWPGPTER